MNPGRDAGSALLEEARSMSEGMLSLVIDPYTIYKADLHFQQGALSGEALYQMLRTLTLRETDEC